MDIKIEYNKSKEFEDDYTIIAIDSNSIMVINRANGWTKNGIQKKVILKIHLTVVDISNKNILFYEGNQRLPCTW